MTLLENQPTDEPRPLPVRQLLIGGVGFLAFLTLLTLAINAIGVDRLQSAIVEAGPAAPLFYIAIKALTYIFAPLTSGPIQVVAGTLFGSVWLGVLYTLIGEVIGGSVSFWIARRWGRPVVRRFVGRDGMAQVDDFYRNRLGGWRSLAIARIVLFSLWDFLSYAAGLTTIKFRVYVIISTALGFIPTLFFVWLGDTVLTDGTTLILVYGLVALLIVLPIIFHRPINRLLQGASRQTHDG